MAKSQNTLIGRTSGSVGGVTFTTWKGINVIKSKAESVANPNTQKQQNQRSKLSLIVALYRLLAIVVAVGFKGLAIGKSAYNAFVSQNIKTAISVDAQNVVSIIYANLKFALGTIGVTPITLVTTTVASKNVKIKHNSAFLPVGSKVTDIAYLCAFNENTNEWSKTNGNIRSTTESTLVFETAISAGDVIHAYLFFKDSDSDNVSDSVYATKIA